MIWKEIFSVIFFIEPATGNILIDLLLPTALSTIFYPLAFSLVRDGYKSGLIDGPGFGSMLHWFIRLGLAYVSILLFNLMFQYWQIIIGLIIISIYIVAKRK